MITISVSAFSREHQLSKATVLRRCRALGIETTEGLTSDAVATLRREFGLDGDVSVIDGEVMPEAMAITVADNTGIPAIPAWDTDAPGESRELAQIRQQQGRHNLETYIAGMTANYVHHRMAQHLAGIDAAFANVAMQGAGLADQAVKGEQK